MAHLGAGSSLGSIVVCFCCCWFSCERAGLMKSYKKKYPRNIHDISWSFMDNHSTNDGFANGLQPAAKARPLPIIAFIKYYQLPTGHLSAVSWSSLRLSHFEDAPGGSSGRSFTVVPTQGLPWRLHSGVYICANARTWHSCKQMRIMLLWLP